MPGEFAEAEAADSTTVPTELSLDESDDEDPERFGDYPVEPSDRWLIGADYEGTSFVHRSTGAILESDATIVQFSGRSQISMASGGCAIGSGAFELVDGRVTNPELAVLLIACSASDPEAYEAAHRLIQAEPEIRVDGDRLLLLGDDHRLELQASGPGIIPIIEDFERFVATSTTAPGVVPARVELTSTAVFVARVDLPTCDLHGSMSTEGEQRTIDMHPTIGHDPCEFSPESDKAAQAFFTDQTVVSRSGDTIEISGPLGVTQFRLATEDDPPLEQETAKRPLPIIPDQPDRSSPAEAGRLSVPWYVERAGATGSGQADVPVPEDWEAFDPTVANVSVPGRGYLQVSIADGPQSPGGFGQELVVTEGPTPVTVKLYRYDGQQVVETGATTTAQQYRYGSDNPNVWNRQIVWIVEYKGQTMTAEVGYPEFPEDSPFTATGNPIDLALTGLDPIDLLHDIRFFE